MHNYLNASLSPEERVKDLIPRMNREEKILQLMQLGAHIDLGLEEGQLPGSLLHCMNDILVGFNDQNNETRLKIPLLIGEDCIHGHSFHPGATIFPTQLALANSWDTELLEEVARVTAIEASCTGVHWTFSPVLCLTRDLRWGRVGETFGEDPYLIGEFATAMIRGYQGEGLNDPNGILATAKHYAGYSETQGGRDSSEADLSVRKLKSYFLPPFKKACEAGCMAYMTGYQSIEGVPSTANRWLLHDVLKEEWGFEGILVTDWDNVGALVKSQKICADYAEAATLAIRSGNDLMMATKEFLQGTLDALDQGMLEESEVDDVLARILLLKFRMGLFENPRLPDFDRQKEVIACEAHKQVNIKAARESLVLLQNPNSLLPLQPDAIQKIAVVGPNADTDSSQLGDWSLGTSQYSAEYGKQPRECTTTVLDGIRTEFPDQEVLFAQGCEITDASTEGIADAVAAAQEADVVVAVVGDALPFIGERCSVATLELQGGQQALLEALAQTGKPMIVVLVSSKPLVLPMQFLGNAAIVSGFNPGMEGGTAIAEVLSGKLNPTGKLTISFPVHVGQQPTFYNQVPGQHGNRYADLTQEPLFPFGHGLSYTSFEYSDFTLSSQEVEKGDTLQATVTLTNTGTRAGTEIAQLYVNDLVTSATWVEKRLVGYDRVPLEAGESKQVTFTLETSDLWIVDAKAEYVVEAGEFRLRVGPSSRDDAHLTQTFLLKAAAS
ncbi:glycoside hydrolase family 3 N-terminal domain-containing protein [Kiritimatiellaeota bacterium B1221]|nr:glycoside hydrolase family 3 N-terminal domain-containing protein [Kiritimatiellaeota bacterium B1221]